METGNDDRIGQRGGDIRDGPMPETQTTTRGTITRVPRRSQVVEMGRVGRTIEKGVSIYAPFFNHVKRAPVWKWISDVTLQAIGGYFPELKRWWRYDLSENELRRASRNFQGERFDAILINLLELLAMTVTA